MPVNPTIEAILAKMDEVIAATTDNTAIVDAITANTAVMTDILNVLNNTYEKVNTMEFNVGLIEEQVTAIEGWDVGTKLGALLDLYNNTLGPLAEAAQFNEREIIANLRVLACLCDVSLLPVGPAPGLLPPADDTEHCRRAAYFVGHTVLRISEVQRLINQGVQLGNDTIAYLLGFNVLIGIDDSVIPSDIRLGLAGLLAQGAYALLDEVKSWIVGNTQTIRDLIHASATAEAAKMAIDALIDNQFPGAGQLIINQVLKLLFSQGAMNVIYDQSIVWDTSDYAAVECNASSFVTLTSQAIRTIQTVNPGPGMTLFDDTRQRIFVNSLPGPTFHYEPTWLTAELWSIESADYSSGADINTVTKLQTWLSGNYFNYRIRYLDGTNTVSIWKDEEEISALGPSWWQFPNETNVFCIVAEQGEPQFQIDVQFWNGTQWEAPY